jgi:hypothetical protein
MKTQITKLENQVLKSIQRFTSEDFSSDTGNWAYVHEIAESIDIRQLRALISTLCQKGILYHEDNEGGFDGSYVEVTENYYKETGKSTPAGSPEIEFINLELR